jgi:hypothetical protein
MKTVGIQVLGGLAAALICVALLLSTLVFVGSLRAYLDAAGSFCGMRIRQFQDVAWLSFLAVTALGITGLALASRCSFYPRVCLLGMIASFLVSLASLVLVGNN